MMKKFIGRRQELQILENLYTEPYASVLISGRQGVGKTALIRQFCSGRCFLYFSARQETDILTRRRMTEAVSEFCKETVNSSAKPMSWKALFEKFSQAEGEDRKILVIDNLQYLLQEDPDFEKKLRFALKHCFKPASVMVILAMRKGKTHSLLKKNRHGIIKELTHQINLKPFSFVEMVQSYPYRNIAQLSMLYGMTGGLPGYWEYFKDCEKRVDFLGSIRSEVLNPYAYLFNEPIRGLASEIWDPALYHGILCALAAGYKKLPEIAKFLNEKTGAVEKAAETLKYLGYLDFENDVLIKKQQSAKKQTLTFSDALARFWYTFVYPHKEVLEAGKDLPVFEGIKTNFSDYMKKTYQDICMDIFSGACRYADFSFNPERIGTLETKDGDQIDLLAIDDTGKQLFMAECVFEGRPYSLDAFEAFQEQCTGVKTMRAFKDYKVIYGVFTTEGFRQDLMDYCTITPDILLFDGITMYAANL